MLVDLVEATFGKFSFSELFLYDERFAANASIFMETLQPTRSNYKARTLNIKRKRESLGDPSVWLQD